jgi:glycosyltransferase involved in cell wall biosynthesis
MMSAPQLVSVIVPLYNEEESLPLLVERVRDALTGSPEWELVLVDDGSRDATAEIASALADADPRVRLIRLARNYGQTAAMQAGFDHARGGVVVSMDGDLQNDPYDIPLLIAKLREGYDLVAGYRIRRKDRLLTRRVPSWVANRLIRGVTGVAIRDNGCSLKVYRRELLDRIHLYSDMHRFIPAVAAGMAGARIAEVPVRHHPRRFGTSKYGLSRVLKVSADLVAIKMIGTFRERPLAMFALGSIMSLLLGLVFASSMLISVTDLIALTVDLQPASTLVIPSIAILWFGLAFYLLMLGLIGEVLVRQQVMARRGPLPLVSEGNG